MSALARRVELSPLTPAGMARRITSDLHPIRTESAFCYLVTVLADAAEVGLSSAEALRILRGLADQADPDGYAETVRITLGADVSQMTEALAGLSQAVERMTPHEAEQRAAEWAATGEVARP